MLKTNMMNEGDDRAECKPRFTAKAHDKDINSVAVAPNDKLIASGSQDRLIKLWDPKDLSLIATLKGHKRGVWCVEFSPGNFPLLALLVVLYDIYQCNKS